jgi:hypothetical protein
MEEAPARPGNDEGRVPDGVDTSVAHQARVYDYWLGGKDNFAVDRGAAELALAAYPGLRRGVRLQRAFLANAVRYLAATAGIRQFLDVGTGIPTANNTHEVAQAVAPAARVVYVDNDPMVLTHARALLTSSVEGATTYLDCDLRDTEKLLRGAVSTAWNCSSLAWSRSTSGGRVRQHPMTESRSPGGPGWPASARASRWGRNAGPGA